VSDSADENRPDAATDDETGAGRGRPFLSVTFACCSVYQRIYRNAEGDAYVGRCPRCGKAVRFPIGPAGTQHRNFTVY